MAAVLTGEAGSVSWKLNFQYDVRTYECRMTCRRNGADDSALQDLLLTAFVDVLKKRFPPEELPLENSNVGEGLMGEFSLSSKDDGELTEAELASCQASIRDAFAEFLETHPDDATWITDQARMSARTMNAARKARAAMRIRKHPFVFPELPRRICWRAVPNHQQMRLDLSTILQEGAPKRSVLNACRRMEKNLQLVKDAPVMQDFKVDFDRALELIDERLGRTNVFLPDGNQIDFELVSPRRGHWVMQWELWDHSSDKSQNDLLAAKIGEIPELKRLNDKHWQVDVGPINDMATFRKKAWSVYVKVRNQLHAICIEIYQL